MTYFGVDDEKRNVASSFSVEAPLSIAGGSTSDTKKLKFRFTPMNDVILSNYACIVIECVNIPDVAHVVNGGVLLSPFTIRTTSITTYKSFDSFK